MMKQEQWLDIDEFPGYMVSDYGRVMGGYKDQVLTVSPNQAGFGTVGLEIDGKQYRRSLSLLVATAFLQAPKFYSIEGTVTPIHLDGDRSNCNADNLMWRPRWFAIKYQQERRLEPYPNWNGSFIVVETNETFSHPRDCAMTHGLLEKNIVLCILNQSSIFPTGFSFVRC